MTIREMTLLGHHLVETGTRDNHARGPRKGGGPLKLRGRARELRVQAAKPCFRRIQILLNDTAIIKRIQLSPKDDFCLTNDANLRNRMSKLKLSPRRTA